MDPVSSLLSLYHYSEHLMFAFRLFLIRKLRVILGETLIW